MARMDAAELLTFRRVVARPRSIAHGGHLSRAEQLKLALPHGPIISRRDDNFRARTAVDHANSAAF
jgi:hypothetical protein